MRTLRTAAPGSFGPRTAAERYDLEAARRATPAERLQRLNEIMLLAEAVELPPASREPIRHGEMKL